MGRWYSGQLTVPKWANTEEDEGRGQRLGYDGQGQCKQQKKRGSRQQGGAGGKRQGNGKWSMLGFSADPGGTVLVAGSQWQVHNEGSAVTSHVILQGTRPLAGRFGWGVDLRREGANITGWMQSGEL